MHRGVVIIHPSVPRGLPAINASQLEKTTLKITYVDQTAFVKNRLGANNVLRLFKIIDIAKRKRTLLRRFLAHRLLVLKKSSFLQLLF